MGKQLRINLSDSEWTEMSRHGDRKQLSSIAKQLLIDECNWRSDCIDNPPLPMLRHGDISIHIRWMIRRDMPEVLSIESQGFEFPWSEDDFIRCLRLRNCIGMVAEFEEHVVGFMIYELHKTRLHILNFAVHPELQRRGVGRQMIEKLNKKLSQQRRSEITFDVRESNVTGLMFLKSCGFKSTAIIRGKWDETDDDAIQMTYVVRPFANSV